MDILQRLFPRPKPEWRERYALSSAQYNIKLLHYFAMVMVVVFLIQLVHHARLGRAIFDIELLPYTFVYAFSIVYGLLNLVVTSSVVSPDWLQRRSVYIEVCFLLYVAGISIFLAVVGLIQQEGPVAFVMGLMTLSVMLQGHLPTLFVVLGISWLLFIAGAYQVAGVTMADAAAASTFSTVFICFTIARLAEKMRIDHFESLQEIQQKNQQLSNLSNQDPLTGLANRRCFEQALRREIMRANRFASNLSMLALDVDNFKNINDTYGHQEGDQVLKGIADILTSHVREVDTVCRYGGEEFIVLLVEANDGLSRSIGERIRKAVSAKHFNNVYLPVTVSIGHKQFQGETAQAFIESADQMMYQAKRQGKNQLVSNGEANSA